MSEFTTHVFDIEKDKVEDYLPAILKLEKECFPPDWQYENAEEEYRKSLADKKDLHVFLKGQGGQVIGYLLTRPQATVYDELSKFDKLFSLKQNTLYIETIQISPNSRSQGGLVALLKELMNLIEKEKETTKLSIHARISNGLSSKIKKLFHKTISEVRQIENWKFGGNEPYEYIEWGYINPFSVRQMLSWANPNVEIKNTDKYGKGVFATRDIKKDETLFVISGYIFTIEDENQLPEEVGDRPIELSESFSLGPLSKDDFNSMPQHYMNHSCDPNVGFNGQIFMVAIKDVSRGEELTWDYAMAMHSNEDSASYFNMHCLCGSRQCRGKITEDDWKKPELQERYDGYFQFFLQNKIRKIRTQK